MSRPCPSEERRIEQEFVGGNVVRRHVCSGQRLVPRQRWFESVLACLRLSGGLNLLRAHRDSERYLQTIESLSRGDMEDGGCSGIAVMAPGVRMFVLKKAVIAVKSLVV